MMGQLDVEATPANRAQEVESTRTMIDRVERQRDLTPRKLVGDTVYGTAALPGWMVEEKQIEPHVSVWDKTTRKDNTFSRSEFIWNEQANEYRCPAGNALRSDWRPMKNPRTHITKADTIVYRSIERKELRSLFDEESMLPKYVVSQNHAQHP